MLKRGVKQQGDMDEFQVSVLKSGWMVIPFAEVAREEVSGWLKWR